MSIDKENLRALAERMHAEDQKDQTMELSYAEAMAFNELLDEWEGATRAEVVLSLLAEIEQLQRIHMRYSDSACRMGEALGIPEDDQSCFSVEESVAGLLNERDQLKAENELMRALIADAATDLRKASAWVCREVEAGTRSATHWAVRLRERADHLDAAMAKEKTQ